MNHARFYTFPDRARAIHVWSVIPAMQAAEHMREVALPKGAPHTMYGGGLDIMGKQRWRIDGVYTGKKDFMVCLMRRFRGFLYNICKTDEINNLTWNFLSVNFVSVFSKFPKMLLTG